MKTIKDKDMKFNKEELEKLSYADLAAERGCSIQYWYKWIYGFTKKHDK